MTSFVTDPLALLLLLAFLAQLGLMALMAVLTWKVCGLLMWFHRAGQTMANMEMERARIEMEAKKADTEMEKIRDARERRLRAPSEYDAVHLEPDQT